MHTQIHWCTFSSFRLQYVRSRASMEDTAGRTRLQEINKRSTFTVAIVTIDHQKEDEILQASNTEKTRACTGPKRKLQECRRVVLSQVPVRKAQAAGVNAELLRRARNHFVHAAVRIQTTENTLIDKSTHLVYGFSKVQVQVAGWPLASVKRGPCICV
jgi:hypothetical protein